MNRIFLAVISCIYLSGCISYGPQNEPSYPFQVVFYEDGTCDITASIKEDVNLKGLESEASLRSHSSWWSFASIRCINATHDFRFALYISKPFDPSIISGRFIRSNQDLIVNLSPLIDYKTPSGSDYHPVLQDQYTATANSNMFFIPLRFYKILSCGSKAYSKNGTATIYSVENTSKSGIYAEVNGRLIAGGRNCF